MTYFIQNKWIVVLGALSSQLAIGAFYAWSLFNKPISIAFDSDLSNVVKIYSVSLLVFSVSTIFSGRLQLKKGPRVTTLIGATLYTLGIYLSSLATSVNFLYFSYGFLAGAGVGFIYVNQLSTLVKWFPNHKGFITGFATAAFAMGAILFKEVITMMFDMDPSLYTVEVVSHVFRTLAIIYGVMTFTGALLLEGPKDYKKPTKKNQLETKDYTTKSLFKTPNFWKLLLSDLFALMPGLLFIGIAKDIGEQYVGLNYTTAAAVVGYIAIANAIGRLLSGSLADKLGAINVYRFMYVITIIALALISFTKPNFIIFLVVSLMIAISYGSFLSLVPTMVNTLFGGKYFSSNYALIFQAYGVAAWVGPIIKDSTSGNFDLTFLIAMITAILGLIAALLIKFETPVEIQKNDL